MISEIGQQQPLWHTNDTSPTRVDVLPVDAAACARTEHHVTTVPGAPGNTAGAATGQFDNVYVKLGDP